MEILVKLWYVEVIMDDFNLELKEQEGAKEVNTIAVMTSGGDSPGMNAAIRAVVRTAKYMNKKVLAFRKGFRVCYIVISMK